MDQQKTGRFICELRKKQNLTQRQLADKLCISDRTVSKWETGNGMPEQSLMLPLCEALGISVNELLSGEKLDGEDYNKMAEENIMKLLKEEEKMRIKSGSIVCLALTLVLIVLYFCLLIPGFRIDNSELAYLSINFLFVFGASTLLLAGCGLLKAFFSAFELAFGKRAEADECRKAVLAVKCAGRAIALLSLFSITVNILGYMFNLDNMIFGPLISKILFLIFIGVVPNITLLPVQARLRLRLDEMKHG